MAVDASPIQVESPVEGEIVTRLESLDDEMRILIERSLEMLIPVEAQPPPVDGRYSSKYNSFVHAKLCRMRLLGLSNSSAANACGISAPTLAVWLRKYPKLSSDLDSATNLANAHAALLLRRMMQGNDATAFQAVKLFLTTHAPEFRERSTVDIGVAESPENVVDQIRRGMYGIVDDVPVKPAVLDAPAASAPVEPETTPVELDFEL